MPEQKKQQQSGDAGQAEVQEKMDEATDQGFIGIEVDPTPNEEYSLEKPDSWKVPEADPKAAAKVGSPKFQNAEEGEKS